MEVTNIPTEEAMTSDNFDAEAYKNKLRDQGFRDDVLDDMAAKKKASLQKDESDFEYVMKLEEVGKSDDHIIVAGFASSGTLDYDDESINQDSLHTAWDEYMRNPVLRYMHGKDQRHPDTIGSVIPEYTTKNGETLKTEFRDGKPFIVAKISNAPDVEDIRVKIQEGILKGFSIGGRANKVSEFCTRVGKNINRIFVKRLSEISVVDLPANKEGFFNVVKGCVGNNCSCELIDDNLNDSIPEVNDDDYQEEYEKLEDNNMAENIEMEMSELKEFVKSTVSEMIVDQDQVEKAEAGVAAVKEAQDLRARIAELEAKVAAQAEELKARPQEAMKAEAVVEEIVVDEVVDKSETLVAELTARIAELETAPLYKAEQTETVEKSEEVVEVSHLASVLRANYGGN